METINYHDRPEMSYSKLKDLIPPSGGPRVFEGLHITKTTPKKKSDPMALGSVVHALTLEPNNKSLYTVIPEDVLTKDGKRSGKKWDAFVEEHQGELLIKRADLELAEFVVNRIKSHPMASRFLKSADEFERELYWQDSETGVFMRGKSDILCHRPMFRYCIDLKTLTCCTLEAFESQINNFLYHLQPAVYLDACEKLFGESYGWAWIAAEVDAPFRVRCFTIDEESLCIGRELKDRTLREYCKRVDSGDWSDEGEDLLIAAGLPAWKIRQEYREQGV